MSYRQRGAISESSLVFGVGHNWSCSLRQMVVSLGGTPETVELHRGGAGWIVYTNGMPQYRDGSILTSVTGGYQIQYPNGAIDAFTTAFSSYYFLTSQTDPAGNITTFNYTVTPSGVLQLSSVRDQDYHSTSLHYDDANNASLITSVVDPFSRTAHLTYDDSTGYLTNIVDVQSLSSSFAYDAGNPGWITNLVTPFSTNTFTYGGADATSTSFYTAGVPVNRSVLITLPNGGNDLYVYRQDCSTVVTNNFAPVPAYPSGSTYDNVDPKNRNSFHWGPLQYVNLRTTNPSNFVTSDYTLGRLRHWLTNAAAVDPSDTLSLERAPSQDTGGANRGQVTWYDYFAKSANNFIGTNAMPSTIAWVLPDGSTRYTHYSRNIYYLVTQEISTYGSGNPAPTRTTSFYYAANNIDLKQEVGPNAEQVISNYFAPGNTFHEPNASYDALNQATLYTYNGRGQVTSVTPPTLLTTTNTYLATTTDTNRLLYTYDFRGSQTFRSNAFTYSSGLVRTFTDERGVTLTKFWDNLQRLTGINYPDGSSISNRYTALDLTAARDRDQKWTYFVYDGLRHLIFETNADNIPTQYSYCNCGALQNIIYALGTPAAFQISFNYDNQGNRTYIYLIDLTVVQSFNAMRQLTQRIDERGTRSFSYNNQGLLSGINNAYGAEQSITYDNENRPTSVTDANGVTISKVYDLLSRLRTNSYPDGGQEYFGYSPFGLTAYTNQMNMTNFVAYDAGGRKAFETNADSQLIQYYYDASGNLTNLVDGNGQSTKWGYNEYSRVTNKLDQTGAMILRYVYDPAGRLTNRWSIAKGNTYYTYDGVGNLTNVTYPSSPSVTLQYDQLNRLTNMVDGLGTTAYTYASGGQLATETSPFASSKLTSTYVNRLRTALSLQQPTGSWTNGFIYDAAGRLTNVTSQAGSFGYILGGAGPVSPLIKKLLLPNTSYVTNTYDNVARLTGTYLDNNANSVLDSAVYGYNRASQRTAFTNAAGTYYQYTYDPIGQLKVAASSVSSENRGYVYDAAWNLNWLTNNGTATQFKADSKNELTNCPGIATYDSNGNRVTASIGQGTIYSYDDENRLITINEQGVFITSFVYDGLGRLRKRIEWTGTYATTEYIYDGTRVIQERDTNNTPTVSYTRGTDLSGTLERAGGIGGLLARSSGYSSGNWSTHYYYHTDGNGNITYLVDSSQALAASYRYDPYGVVISSSGPQASANVYRFSSKEQHINSSFYIYLYRFYDPYSLRWLNRDPFAENGGINLYAYVGNTPPNGIDPLGLGDDTHWPTPGWEKGKPNTPWRSWDPPPIGIMPPGGDITVSTAASTPMQGVAGLPGLLSTTYDPVFGAPLGYTIATALDWLFGPEPSLSQLTWDLQYGSPPPGETWLVPPRPCR